MNITDINNNGTEIQLTITGEVIPVRYITDNIHTYVLVRWKHVGGYTEALYEVIKVYKVSTYEYSINNTAPLYTFNRTF